MRKRKTAGENEKNQIQFAVTTQNTGSRRLFHYRTKKRARANRAQEHGFITAELWRQIARAQTGARYLAII